MAQFFDKKNRRWIEFTVLLAVAVGLLAAQGLRRPPAEPVYQGRTVREWAMQLAMYIYGGSTEPANAIREFGTNAIPTLLLMVQRKDPPVLPGVRSVLLECARTYFPQSQPALYRLTDRFRPCAAGERRAAVYAFRALGAEARQASPALIKLHERYRASGIQWEIGLALMAIDPEAAAKLGVK